MRGPRPLSYTVGMTRRDVPWIGALAVAAALLFVPGFFLGRVPFAGDVTFSFHPWLTYAAQEIQAGRLPLWNCYSSCGEPFLANPQIMVFHPPALLFWIFPFAAAWRLGLGLNAGLLFLGTLFLVRTVARRADRSSTLLAGLATALGGFAVVNWEFPALGATLAILPFLLLFSWSGRHGWIPWTTALLFFGGYTPLTEYGLLWAGAAVLWRGARERRWTPAGFWALGVGGGLLVALPQILPSWELAGRSLRSAITEADAARYLLTPALLLKIAIPNLLDKAASPFNPSAFGAEFWPVQRNWLSTFYVGTAPLLLALGAAFSRPRRKIFWIGSGAFFLLLAMGCEPIFTVVRRFVPGFRYMTHFSNAAVVSVLAVALLAAAGGSDAAARKTAARFAGGLAALCFVGTLWAASRTWLIGAMLGTAELTAVQDQRVRWAFVETGLIAIGVGLMAPRPRWGTAGLLCLTLLELAWNAAGLHPLAPAGFFRERVALAAQYQNQPRRFALTPAALDTRGMAGDNLVDGYRSLRQAGFPTVMLPYRAPNAWSYEVFGLSDFAAFRRRLSREDPGGPVLDFLGVEGLVAHGPLSAPRVPVARSANALFYRNPGALERVTAVALSTTVVDASARLQYLSTAWDPRREVVLEGPASAPPTDTPPEIHWTDRPGRVEFKGRGVGWAVQSAPFYPGWEVYVNGSRETNRRANHAFQAVALPAGEWRGAWIYRPAMLRWGVLLALTGLAGLGAEAVRRARRFV